MRGPGRCAIVARPQRPDILQAIPMKLKNKCCFKFESKAKVCKKCPIMAAYTKKKRKKKLAKIKARIRQAA
jgi:hypothetical protein